MLPARPPRGPAISNAERDRPGLGTTTGHTDTGGGKDVFELGGVGWGVRGDDGVGGATPSLDSAGKGIAHHNEIVSLARDDGAAFLPARFLVGGAESYGSPH